MRKKKRERDELTDRTHQGQEKEMSQLIAHTRGQRERARQERRERERGRERDSPTLRAVETTRGRAGTA